MPGPDERKWETRDSLWQRLKQALLAEFPALATLLDTPAKRERARAAVVSAMGPLQYEFKALRLTEKLKDAIEKEAFGPLFLDADGGRVDPAVIQDWRNPPEGVKPTQAYLIWRKFKDIYTIAVLDLYDEEGELKT